MASVCKEWKAVYLAGKDHDCKQATFWHDRQSSRACLELWLEDIEAIEKHEPYSLRPLLLKGQLVHRSDIWFFDEAIEYGQFTVADFLCSVMGDSFIQALPRKR